MISQILTLIICYLGLIGGFILHKFAKEELIKIRKKQKWFIKRSPFVYLVLAFVFYLTIDYGFFSSVASVIFLYGMVVGSMKKGTLWTILRNNLIFLIAGIGFLLLKF